jgi:hypothetical protein
LAFGSLFFSVISVRKSQLILVFVCLLIHPTPLISFVVVRVQDAFVANEQLTLVFPCYEGTLINYISKIPFSSTNDLNQPFQPSSLDPSVLSPKFIFLPSLLPFPHRLLSSPPRTGLSDQFPIRLIVPLTAPHTHISLTTPSLQQLLDNLLKIFEILPRSFSLLFGS